MVEQSPPLIRRHRSYVFAGVVLLLLMGFVWMLAAQRKTPTADEMRSHLQNGKCQDCHREIYAEWAESAHARAWTSELYQMLRQKYDAEQTCDACHAPQPVLMTGVGGPPKLRDEDRARGVDCLSCHLDANGAMRGPYNDRSPFHKVQREPTLYTRQATLCASCHGQKTAMAHNVVDEFRASPAARQGKTCQSCHMPQIDRKPSRYSRRAKVTRAHSWPGSRSEARLESTVLMDWEETDAGIRVTIVNTAGHAIPAAPMREIRVGVLLTSADGKILYSHVETYRHPLDVAGDPVEPGATDNRPKAGERREFPIPFKPADLKGARLTASALYRRTKEAPWVQMANVRYTF